MDGREIPGFYFDAEKNKYFKVQPNHVAPAGSKYSHENVRKAYNLAKRQKLEQDRAEIDRRQRVQRPRILKSHGAHRASLDLETAAVESPLASRRLQTEALVAGFRVVQGPQLMPSGARGQRVAQKGVVESLWDSERQCLVYAQLDRPEEHFICATGFWSDVEYPQRQVFAHRIRAPISMSLSPSGVLATTTWGFDRPGVAITCLQPRDLVPRDHDLILHSARFELPTHNEDTAWSCAANHHLGEGGQTTFAIGLSDSIVLCKEVRHDWDTRETTGMPSNVLSLSWLDANVLASGQRNRTVYLWDTRASGKSARSQRLIVSDAVDKLVCVNDSQILVRGINNGMALFDLRMSSKARAAPVVTYPHTNTSGVKLAFDACAELDIVASADEDGNVHVYSIHGGNELGVFDKPKSIRKDAVMRTCTFKGVEEAGQPALIGFYDELGVMWSS